MSQRKGSLGWTKFDGVTYTPLGLRITPKRHVAEKIAKCLKKKQKIKGYRILEYSDPFGDRKGHVIYVKGKFGHMGHLNKDIKACEREVIGASTGDILDILRSR